MENKSLTTLAADFQRLMNLITEAGGELTKEIETALEVNQEMLAAKADRYDFIISKLESEAGFWKSKAEQFTRVARACETARERLRNTIKGAMQAMDTTEIVGESVTFRLSNSSPRLVIDQAKLPAGYIVETLVREPNKVALRQDLKAGQTISGATLEPVQALRITVSRKG